MLDCALMRKDTRLMISDMSMLVLSISLFYLILLGTRPLFVPDEGRYAEIAREMLQSGNYITPHLNGIKYFEKPPLFYWLAAAAMQFGGVNLWSLRLVNAFLGVLGCIATYFTAYKLYDRKTALLAASILASTALYFVMAHMINLDLTVSFFLAITLYAFILGVKQKQNRYFLLAAAFAACAVLTKGLIGIVFPILIIGLWIVCSKEWRLITQINYLTCVSVFLCIALPWHLLVGYHNPEFYYFYFIEQHFLRYTTEAVGHYQPFWFFIPALLLGFFPWIVFLPGAFIKSFTNKFNLFLLIWIVSIFVFFSFSKSKLIPYILPVFPPLAILVANHIKQINPFSMKISALLLILMAAIIDSGLLFFLFHTPLPNIQIATRLLTSAIVVLSMGAISIYVLSHLQHIQTAIIAFSIMTSIFLLLLLAAVPAIDTRTILPLAQIIQPKLRASDEIITFNQYYQDLPFYLHRKVRILNWRNELTFGALHQPDAQLWLIGDAQFWQLWTNPERRVFVVIATNELLKLQKLFPQHKFFVLGQTINNSLVTNQA